MNTLSKEPGISPEIASWAEVDEEDADQPGFHGRSVAADRLNALPATASGDQILEVPVARTLIGLACVEGG